MDSNLRDKPDQWRSLVADVLREKGYQSTVEFLNAFPGIPFGQVYRMICYGDSKVPRLDIGIARFEDAIFFKAANEGATRWVTLDMLVRSLREHLGKAWGRGTNARLRQGRAYSEWRFPSLTDAEYENTNAICKRIWSRLEAAARPDWKPIGNDDPIIVEAFAAEWPTTVAPPPGVAS